VSIIYLQGYIPRLGRHDSSLQTAMYSKLFMCHCRTSQAISSPGKGHRHFSQYSLTGGWTGSLLEFTGLMILQQLEKGIELSVWAT
jgi:hypothetical protein